LARLEQVFLRRSAERTAMARGQYSSERRAFLLAPGRVARCPHGLRAMGRMRSARRQADLLSSWKLSAAEREEQHFIFFLSFFK